MGKKKAKKTKNESSDEESKEEKPKAHKNTNKNESKEKENEDTSPVVEPTDKKGVVDAFFKDRAKYHVWPVNDNTYNGKYYSCILNNTENNCHKFYVMQLLKNNTNYKSVLFTRWGRIGQPGQNRTDPVDNNSGPKLFMKKYHDRKRHGYEEDISDGESEKENCDSSNK